MDIDDFVELRAVLRRACSILRSSSTISSGCSMVAGSLSICVKHGVNLRSLAQNLGFHAVTKLCACQQRHGFVQLHMLLDAQACRDATAR